LLFLPPEHEDKKPNSKRNNPYCFICFIYPYLIILISLFTVQSIPVTESMYIPFSSIPAGIVMVDSAAVVLKSFFTLASFPDNSYSVNVIPLNVIILDKFRQTFF